LSVARLAPCSVLIARPRGASGGDGESFKRILVGLDGSPLGQLALRIALDLAGLFGATVLGVTVREVSPLARAESLADPYADQLQAAAVEHARAAGVTFERIMRGGHAAQTLCEQAREGSADLIVLGATGLEHPWSVTLGGTAMRVATDAPCDVLLVRPPQAALHVRDVMVRGVSSVMPDTPVAEVVELLLRRNVKAIPVVSAAGRVEGIITGGDLLRHGDLGLRLSIQQELDADTLGDRLRGLARGQKLARDLMTRPVHTVEREVDLATAIRLMATRQVKRLPVVDRRGELVGMVSRADILRAIAAMPEPSGEAEGALHHGARTVGDAITTGVPRVGPEAPAEEVLAKLLESPMRRVVVTESDGRALGIISDRDLLARTSPDVRPWLLRALTGGGSGRPSRKAGGAGVNLPLTARDLMAPSLVAVRPEDSIGHAIRLMMQHRVKRLVVVDGEGRLLGLVDRREVLRSLVAPALA
jgi:CBS-domain-containing membrane protein/nucleotide-binding universal stress UspA family protein